MQRTNPILVTFQQKAETQPYREEEEDVKAELRRLMDSLQQDADSHDDVKKKGLYQCAADVIGSYVNERIPRSKLDSELLDLLDRLEIADVTSAQYPAIWQEQSNIPKPADMINCLCDVFVSPRDDDVTLMFEPGRVIVGDAGVYMTTTLGWKTSGNTRFLVVDGGMNDVIRPSLYGAYHHIYPAAPPPDSHALNNAHNSALDLLHGTSGSSTNGHVDFHVVDVVGPVCESGDFLGKDRLLPLPSPGSLMVLHDAGAYCSSMASNYNLRLRPAEVLVDGSDCDFIRRPDTLNDLLAPYKTSTN
ncbi:hypothetical protein V1264_018250 [Littorina saxatilis]|uniref:Orn/DAP/Arg decarboxylase 2 C-terminal domain-containing protein n=1 Tax=Littorina saxatilis TaxID=31220 RepID=A0AAN9BC50_9CAEN